MMNNHRTIGIDLVAMCVNDLIVDQAKPLFFLITSQLENLIFQKEPDIKGIIDGCKNRLLSFRRNS